MIDHIPGLVVAIVIGAVIAVVAVNLAGKSKETGKTTITHMGEAADKALGVSD